MWLRKSHLQSNFCKKNLLKIIKYFFFINLIVDGFSSTPNTQKSPFRIFFLTKSEVITLKKLEEILGFWDFNRFSNFELWVEEKNNNSVFFVYIWVYDFFLPSSFRTYSSCESTDVIHNSKDEIVKALAKFSSIWIKNFSGFGSFLLLVLFVKCSEW